MGLFDRKKKKADPDKAQAGGNAAVAEAPEAVAGGPGEMDIGPQTAQEAAEPPQADDEALLFTASDQEEEDDAGLPGVQEDEEDEDDLSDLMDIFTSEEEEDIDLVALTRDLEDVSVEELLEEALQVEARLRRLAAVLG